MRYKCKKSAFCILFLLFFGFGTICGIVLFQCLVNHHSTWITVYCKTLVSTGRPPFFTLLFFACRPLLVAALLGCASGGYRAIPFLIAVRGFLTAYFMSAYFVSALSPIGLVLRDALLLPFFYVLCYRAYDRKRPAQMNV